MSPDPSIKFVAAGRYYVPCNGFYYPDDPPIWDDKNDIDDPEGYYTEAVTAQEDGFGYYPDRYVLEYSTPSGRGSVWSKRFNTICAFAPVLVPKGSADSLIEEFLQTDVAKERGLKKPV